MITHANDMFSHSLLWNREIDVTIPIHCFSIPCPTTDDELFFAQEATLLQRTQQFARLAPLCIPTSELMRVVQTIAWLKNDWVWTPWSAWSASVTDGVHAPVSHSLHRYRAVRQLDGRLHSLTQWEHQRHGVLWTSWHSTVVNDTVTVAVWGGIAEVLCAAVLGMSNQRGSSERIKVEKKGSC
jgi:hypothetical protein